MVKIFRTSPWIMGLMLLGSIHTYGQKAPLDHSVYDTWESLGTNNMTSDGKIIYYIVNQQEGDARLYVKDHKNNLLVTVDRAANAQLTHQEHYLVALIKPTHAETREARIKKKKPDEMPKDTLAILDLKSFQVHKIPAVKSFQLIEENGSYLAYMADVPVQDNTNKPADSTLVATEVPTPAEELAAGRRNSPPRGGRSRSAPGKPESRLFLYSFTNGVDTAFERIDSYVFDKAGNRMLYVRKAKDRDSVALDAGVFMYDVNARQSIQISPGKGDYRNLTVDEGEQQLAFFAYKGDEKALFKPFSLYYYSFAQTSDTAKVLIGLQTPGMPSNWHVGTSGPLRFSKDGEKLFFGIAPIPPQKDTTLVDFENAKVDIWHWKDDYLQTQQLVNLRREQGRTYLAVVNPKQGGRLLQLADEKVPDTRIGDDGKDHLVLATSDFGRRIQGQWGEGGYQDIYLVSTLDGTRQLIRENFKGSVSVSPGTNYVTLFDRTDGNWYIYNIAGRSTKQLNTDVTVSFADEDNDVPDDPNNYGLVGWNEDETELYLNDKYDIWAFNLKDGKARMITNGLGRLNKITFRYQRTQKAGNQEGEETGGRFGRMSGAREPVDFSKPVILNAFDHTTKMNGFYKSNPRTGRNPEQIVMAPYRFSGLRSTEKGDVYLYSKENYESSPNFYYSKDLKSEMRLSETNPQQANYNWGTAELFRWTTPNGHAAEGILYKPEDFDPNKQYPIIAYFYEKLSDGLYSYQAPSPTPSRLNISFFVSNGYLVFAPDIRYEIGYPGRSAEEYVNSGMAELAKKPWVNENKMGIQGQSWGGYQVAHLITVNDMYAAAWSGAPVVNMTSAYGGIRWDSGMNRQFQYEKTQSRLGATLWERPDLYIENSPLFHFPKVNTPVAIMHNDEDGAVPWYQGIEMFTALRRLNKPVWLLNYNGDKHNLMQRQNRKDIQRRQLEFFNHFLKDKPAAPWIDKGVPAIMKGIDWGFGSDDN